MGDATAALVGALIGGVVSLGAAAVTYHFGRKGHRISTEQYFLARNQLIIEWGRRVLDSISMALSLTYVDPSRMPDFFDRRLGLISSLSSQIDEGRMYFANIVQEEVGKEKGLAYRGLRIEVLNSIVFALEATKALNYIDGSKNKELRPKLVEAKRIFSSELQREVDPRRHDRVKEEVLGKSGANI